MTSHRLQMMTCHRSSCNAMTERYRNKSIDEQGGIVAKLDREVAKHNGYGSADFGKFYVAYKENRLKLASWARLMGVSDETLRHSWIPLWEKSKGK